MLAIIGCLQGTSCLVSLCVKEELRQLSVECRRTLLTIPKISTLLRVDDIRIWNGQYSHTNRVTAKKRQLMLANAVAALSDWMPESWFGNEFTAAACSVVKTSLTTSSAASHVWHSHESRATVAIHRQVTKISMPLSEVLSNCTSNHILREGYWHVDLVLVAFWKSFGGDKNLRGCG